MKKITAVLAAFLMALLPLFAGGEAITGNALDPHDIIIGEESGGEFRPLPLDLTGGAPLMKSNYHYDIKVYQDPTIRVERHRVEGSSWGVTYNYALITVRDPSQLRTAPADGKSFTSSAKVPVAAMARRCNAVFAINGDFCAAFAGNKASSYILREGVVYRDSVEPELDILLVDEAGDFHILPAGADLAGTDKTQIDGKKVVNAFQFGPALIIDGQKVADEVLTDPGHSPAYAEPGEKAQRLCIAQVGERQYLVVYCRWGMNLPDFRDLVASIADVKNAYVLDGGLSAQLVFLNKKYNNLTVYADNPRPVTDIIYFASAWFAK